MLESLYTYVLTCDGCGATIRDSIIKCPPGWLVAYPESQREDRHNHVALHACGPSCIEKAKNSVLEKFAERLSRAEFNPPDTGATGPSVVPL